MSTLRRTTASMLALVLAGCTVPVAMLGSGPLTAGDPMILDYALQAARAEGYRPVELDPSGGRFEVAARNEHAHFAVQCFADGWVSVIPSGPTVERDGSGFSMSRRLRDEYGHFAEAIDDAMDGAR